MTPPNRVHSAKVETNKVLEPTAVHKTDTLVKCQCSQSVIPLDLIANNNNNNNNIMFLRDAFTKLNAPYNKRSKKKS